MESIRVRMTVAAIAVAVLSGCGSGGDGNTSSTLIGGSGGGQNSVDSPEVVVAPADDLIDPQQIQIESARDKPGDSQTLIVDFQLGDEKCFGHQLLVQESEDAITLDLIAGAKPGVNIEQCSDEEFLYRAEVKLSQPRNGRDIKVAEEREPGT